MLSSFEKDLKIIISAKYPIVYIVSWEEERVENSILKIGEQLNKSVYFWSVTDGLNSSNSGINSQPISSNLSISSNHSTNDILSAIDYIKASNDNAIFVFKDPHPYLKESFIVRKLRDLSLHIIKSKKSVLFISPILNIPTELEKEITIMDFPLPDIAELNIILENISKAAKNNPNIKVILNDRRHRERILKAAQGLTATEAENVFAKALVLDGCLDVSDVEIILNEKKQIIRKSGLIEYYETDEKIENIGGLENLKEWIKKRAKSFTEDARNFGLPEPKGVLLLGVQGCGKSLTAKAISSILKLPLLRLDMGAIFGKYVGESEYNIRRAIKTAESIAPVILWLDELEKGFSGLKGSEDAGTSARVFGTFLTWMQEKTKPVFIVATSNDISSLPPELLRKGRFDEIFFVDLPNKLERKKIFKIHINKKGREDSKFDLDTLVNQTDGYSGAEIEQIIISGLYDAFDDNRDINQEDLINNIKKSVPLSKTMEEKIDWLKNWAKGRAVSASN